MFDMAIHSIHQSYIQYIHYTYVHTYIHTNIHTNVTVSLALHMQLFSLPFFSAVTFTSSGN